MDPARGQNQNCGAQNRDEPMASESEGAGWYAGGCELSARLEDEPTDLPRRRPAPQAVLFETSLGDLAPDL